MEPKPGYQRAKLASTAGIHLLRLGSRASISQGIAVLSVYLPARDSSSRWKEVVEPSKGRFTYHIELWSEKDVDEFVRSKLREAWQHAA